MPKVYTVYKQVVCSILGCGCGELIQDCRYTPPDCKNCRDYLDWKKSGMATEEHIDSLTDKLL